MVSISGGRWCAWIDDRARRPTPSHVLTCSETMKGKRVLKTMAVAISVPVATTSAVPTDNVSVPTDYAAGWWPFGRPRRRG